jgi:hypothetical protein
MNPTNDLNNTTEILQPFEQPFSIADWLRHWGKAIRYAFITNLKMVLLMTILGAAAGLAYSILKPVRYNAEITFSVEDSKSIGGGLLSSIGGSLGMDIGSLTGSGNGLLSGDNVLSLLKSKSMMSSCLKTPYAMNDTLARSTNAYCLADRYADVYGLREKWAKNAKIGRSIYFANPDKDIRLQDSLLKLIIKRVEEKEFNVTKPDKKLGFFNVAINTKDELLSFLITQRIIKIATDFYVNSKVGRLRNNIERLEKRTDSISALLNQRTYAATEDTRMLLNINPANINAPVFSEISQRDKMVLTTIYGELMKNLEVSKAALIQETPTVQIVDAPVFPLDRIETKWYEGIMYGALIGFVVIIGYFVYKQNN